jgi:hypothetical protein
MSRVLENDLESQARDLAMASRLLLLTGLVAVVVIVAAAASVLA